jgi:hypothetical protein
MTFSPSDVLVVAFAVLSGAFSAQALTADEAAASAQSTVSVESGFLTLSYDEPKAAGDLVFRLQTCSDLRYGWVTPNDSLTETARADLGSVWRVTLRDTVPISQLPSPSRFLRLRVYDLSLPSSLLLAPTMLRAEWGVPLRAVLYWNDQTPIETGYLIERRTGLDGLWEEIATIAADTNSFEDWSIAGSANYFYRASALLAADASEPTNEAEITTPLDTDQDGIPDDYEAAYNTNPQLFSSGNNGASDGWWVLQGLNPYSSSTQDTDGDGRSDEQEFLDGTNPWVADASPTAGLGAPLAPGDLSVTTLEPGHYELNWTNNDPTTTTFIIERTGNGGDWRMVGTVPGSETTFTDATATPGTVYFYRVIAHN